MVEIRIALDGMDPPTGRLWSDAAGRADEAPLSFTGWLGLLRALYEVLEQTGDGPSSRT